MCKCSKDTSQHSYKHKLTHLPTTNSFTHSCIPFSCRGDNLFVRSRLSEICQSHSVNVRMAGRAVVPQGVQGFLSLCVYVSVCASSDIGGGICAPVRVCMSLVFITLFLWRRRNVEHGKKNCYICIRQRCNLNLITRVLILLCACSSLSFSSSRQHDIYSAFQMRCFVSSLWDC